MGQGIYDYRGLHIYEHGGADAGYRTDLMRIPGQRFSVNVLANNASFNPGDIASKIRDIYLGGMMKAVTERPVQPVVQADTGKPELTPDLLLTYSGKYEVEPGMVATITADNNDLFAEAPGLQKTKLVPVSKSKFAIKEADAEITFLPDENGKITRMMVWIQGQQITAMRLPDFNPDAVKLDEYSGEYYSEELNTGYTFLVESGKLVARHFRTGDIHLVPVKENVFNGDQWYFGQMEFVRDENNHITGCKVGGGRVRNLKFTKL
jgi:hypothetical protein